MKAVKVYFFDDAASTLAKEAEYRKRVREIREKLGDASQEDIDSSLSALATKMGLNVFGEDAKHKDDFQIASDKHVGFNLGSWPLDDSYTGLDYVLTSYGLESVLECLRDALDPVLRQSGFNAYKVDWKKAAMQIDSLLMALKEKLNESISDKGHRFYGVYPMPVAYHEENQARVKDPTEALRIAAQERKRSRRTGNHVNDLGLFLSKEPKELHAVINGVYKDHNCVYAIYYQDLTWYVQLLDVIKETIDVISQLSKDKRAKAHLVIE